MSHDESENEESAAYEYVATQDSDEMNLIKKEVILNVNIIIAANYCCHDHNLTIYLHLTKKFCISVHPPR